MLQLYDARSRLINRHRDGLVGDVSADSVIARLPQPLVIFSESIDVQTAQKELSTTAAKACLVARGDVWLGIVRRESLDIIVRSKRFEALQLPLTSVMLRSFILLADTTSLTEATEEFIQKRALGAIVVSEDGVPVNVMSVDWLEEQLRPLNEEDADKSMQSVRAQDRAQLA